MSIFINNEAKENLKDYWFGLGVPILIGWGSSLTSLMILIQHESSFNEYPLAEYFLITFWISGHLLIWPFLGYRFFKRANKLGNVPREKGARLSIILYLFWIALLLLGTIMSIMEDV
mgnify:CR=1 FL=1